MIGPAGAATEGEVFLVEQDAVGAGVVIQWTSAETLTIGCARCNASLLRKQDERWKDVAVKYQSPVWFGSASFRCSIDWKMISISPFQPLGFGATNCVIFRETSSAVNGS